VLNWCRALQETLERLLSGRTALLIIRIVAAVALVLGIGRALPILIVDVLIRYSIPPPTWALEPVSWLTSIAPGTAGTAALLLAAVGVASTSARGELDGVGLVLVTFG
jgi:hypothetical protein